jgi:hypothetical protein
MGRKPLTEQKPRPVCTKCNKGLCKPNGTSKNGLKKYSKFCQSCHKITYNLKVSKGGRRAGYGKFKKECCELCGFIPVHACQLDVDHIDGDSTNNDVTNLQTLCANCHRLKTYLTKKPSN